jgi:ribosome maturation factor RimP
VEVITQDDSRAEGKLLNVSNDGITIELVSGKGRKAVVNNKNFLYNEIKHIKVLITF